MSTRHGLRGSSCSTAPTRIQGRSSTSPRRSSVRKNQQRDDVQPSSDDNTLVNGVAGDVDALGYFGLAYFEENSSKLRAIPIQNERSGHSGDASRSHGPRPDLQAALASALHLCQERLDPTARRARVPGSTISTYRDTGEEGGYVPPTPEERAANQKALKAASQRCPGSHRKGRSVGSTTLRPRCRGRRTLVERFQVPYRARVGSDPALFIYAAITVLTTAGIIVVLGVETVEFFRKSGVGLMDFLTGTVLKPELSPPQSMGSCRSSGGPLSSRPVRRSSPCRLVS